MLQELKTILSCLSWPKIIKENKIKNDIVIENNDKNLNRTKKVYQAINDICYSFDLAKPIWLDITISDFKKHGKTRFTRDNFIESISFDYLEIEVIEEDDDFWDND